MNADTKTQAPPPAKLPQRVPRKAQRPLLLQFPGLIAISFYMLLLAFISIVSVVNHRFGPVYLFFSVLFIAGALGLLLLLRWAWALSLAAVALLVGLLLWTYTTQHNSSSLVQGLLNLVIFLYLMRTDLREKLR
ncbi:MAG: hypothetical protein ABSC62_02980 [Terracidiphilus sp.]|jgi:uncharacterized membrane protein (DUF2068 family)